MLPLQDKTYLLTRARHQVEAFAQRLIHCGAGVQVFPTLAIRFLPLSATALAHLESFTRNPQMPCWWVFTSANGVDALWQQLRPEQQDLLRDPHRTLNIACVGPQTAARLARYGVFTQWVPETHHAGALAEGLQKRLRGEVVHLWQAQEGRQTLQNHLRAAGDAVETHRVYQTIKPDSCNTLALEHILDTHVPDGIIFTSPSSVVNFSDCLTPALRQQLENTRYHSIGPITSEAVSRWLGPVTCEAEPHTLEGLVTHLCAYEQQHQV